MPALLKHLWEPGGVTLGSLLCVWLQKLDSFCDWINIIFSSRRFMTHCQSDSEFLNKEIMDEAKSQWEEKVESFLSLSEFYALPLQKKSYLQNFEGTTVHTEN